MNTGSFEWYVDARHRLADDIVGACAFRFEFAGDFSIELLSTKEIDIGDGPFCVALGADHSLRHCELLYRRAQAL